MGMVQRAHVNTKRDTTKTHTSTHTCVKYHVSQKKNETIIRSSGAIFCSLLYLNSRLALMGISKSRLEWCINPSWDGASQILLGRVPDPWASYDFSSGEGHRQFGVHEKAEVLKLVDFVNGV